ncbi:esterase/lipase family protein [Phycisphaera mikurensis]|uniref:AB hydrolase-1 domain-containing protein n=1 Tax=Phycisphaera mikurensis (strain NBRC 102666 / KCTC 22515 / FYK2301M01) TaxID=1142394 RepID=I0IFY8_PHYMF|nr:alpha/beta hydrolase [Phycisphaera mikurensis]MBB6440438.1 pimeloyl-ACP methyl ester carboxylesterase [Phycisphaera mikurensis]BAM04176.1 hypothetical protein PSMK_20170 [Phycisphaera mikurensis NBRC 102666]
MPSQSPPGSSLDGGLAAFARSVALWPPPADGPENPSFPLTVRDAWADLHRMHREPAPQPRPLVLVGGWLDPLVGMRWVQRRLGKCFARPRILLVHHAIFATHRAYRDRLVAAVDAAFPGEEVDVVGHSMGGLLARYAARPVEGAKRIRIHSLYTLGTCHRGAAMAPLVPLEPLARAMLPGSPHLRMLDDALPAAEYRLVCYARLQDELVGTDRCAPAAHPLHWVPNRRFQRAHRRCRDDARLIADVARRIRGEEPFAKEPAAPLP